MILLIYIYMYVFIWLYVCSMLFICMLTPLMSYLSSISRVLDCRCRVLVGGIMYIHNLSIYVYHFSILNNIYMIKVRSI